VDPLTAAGSGKQDNLLLTQYVFNILYRASIYFQSLAVLSNQLGASAEVSLIH